ncbi:MAG: hypothetical protein LBP76_09765 [Treponema sp.]|nr:hypothetical protein [Treponema sp.]
MLKLATEGLSRLPLELAAFREPQTKVAAESGAMALIEYLKNQLKKPNGTNPTVIRDTITAGAWLEKKFPLDIM